jgi:hypothetical protein
MPFCLFQFSCFYSWRYVFCGDLDYTIHFHSMGNQDVKSCQQWDNIPCPEKVLEVTSQLARTAEHLYIAYQVLFTSHWQHMLIFRLSQNVCLYPKSDCLCWDALYPIKLSLIVQQASVYSDISFWIYYTINFFSRFVNIGHILFSFGLMVYWIIHFNIGKMKVLFQLDRSAIGHCLYVEGNRNHWISWPVQLPISQLYSTL